MNGILDDQTSGNVWPAQDNPLPMGHSRTGRVSASGDEVLQLHIEDLEGQLVDHKADFVAMIKLLKGFFIFTKAEDIESFLWSYRTLIPVLLEAVPHFRESFAQAPLALDIMTEEGATRTIYALALWRGGRTEARAALDVFDESWWLDNLPKTGGRIVFDYELLK